MTNRKSFASDNNSGAHPKIMKALAQANAGHTVAYGDDPYTRSAGKKFKEVFGRRCEVFFVFNGTGANVTALAAAARSFGAVICSSMAHIHTSECNAVENFIGCKLIPIPTGNGKITPEQIELQLKDLGDQHAAQPMAVSITQATELGTVYSAPEVKEIADFAHEHGLWVHVDGARISNAAASLNSGLRAITADAGVDVLSFGGTKNGLMFGEAVVFFNPRLVPDFRYLRKQAAQLASKMRFIAAQFEAYLCDDLWLENAQNANAMARLLAAESRKIPRIKLVQPVEANEIFAQIPNNWIPKLRSRYPFEVWDEHKGIARWVTSYDTTAKDIKEFISFIQRST